MSDPKNPSPIPAAAVVWGEGCHVGQFCSFGRIPMATAANRRKLAPSDRLLKNVHIGPHSVVGDRVTIYGDVWIGPEACIGDGAVIREMTRIGSRCVIGTNADIQYCAMIGDDVVIQCEAHVAGGTVIGNGSFIGPGVRMANDRSIDPANYQDHGTRKPPVIGERVMIGVGAIILPGVTIGDDAVIAGGAVVARDVPAGMTVKGEPARPYSARGVLLVEEEKAAIVDEQRRAKE